MRVPTKDLTTLRRALPYWVPFALFPVAIFGAWAGGLWTLLLPIGGWAFFIALDGATGITEAEADPDTPPEALFWYRLGVVLWVPVQAALILGMIWWVAAATHLSMLEKVAVFFGVGTLSGTIGINYAHELMHQRSRLERWLGDVLMTLAFYGHFRSEHLLVHHRLACTPEDPATSYLGESFYHFFARIQTSYPITSFAAERALLARRGQPWWHRSNPFWRYAALQLSWLGLATLLGGALGLGLFLFQAAVAVLQLEMVNYVEHYGLSRKRMGPGKYEHFKPHHSWNASWQGSNWLLINLQRHSDHHMRPDRRFPLLQSHLGDAPQLPHGYPVMTLLALFPPLWHRVMDGRVEAWRAKYYPEITDWAPYAPQGQQSDLALAAIPSN